jgi:hypothetical protein
MVTAVLGIETRRLVISYLYLLLCCVVHLRLRYLYSSQAHNSTLTVKISTKIAGINNMRSWQLAAGSTVLDL